MHVVIEEIAFIGAAIQNQTVADAIGGHADLVVLSSVARLEDRETEQLWRSSNAKKRALNVNKDDV